ncbi:MAG: hypothetical protein WAK89_17590, partial [Candidatus Sulfotelmatobacter sp.]
YKRREACRLIPATYTAPHPAEAGKPKAPPHHSTISNDAPGRFVILSEVAGSRKRLSDHPKPANERHA